MHWGRFGLGAAGLVGGALWAWRASDRATVARLRAELTPVAGQEPERFSQEMVADLPEPARRYFLHAVAPGTPLASAADIEMRGAMRLGYDQRWLRMRARQILAPPRGFVWEAAVGAGLLRFAGADSYADGRGRLAFRLWGVLPIARSAGPDVSRSARGRLAIESIWQPAALLPHQGVTWTASDDDTATATVTIDAEPIPVTLRLDADGRVRSALMQRWGNLTANGRYAAIPFGVTVLDECSAEGYTVPGRVTVSWWPGSERHLDFFQARVTRWTALP